MDGQCWTSGALLIAHSNTKNSPNLPNSWRTAAWAWRAGVRPVWAKSHWGSKILELHWDDLLGTLNNPTCERRKGGCIWDEHFLALSRQPRVGLWRVPFHSGCSPGWILRGLSRVTGCNGTLVAGDGEGCAYWCWRFMVLDIENDSGGWTKFPVFFRLAERRLRASTRTVMATGTGCFRASHGRLCLHGGPCHMMG